MRCIIIDDDKLSTKIIAEFVERTEGLDLINSFDSPVDAINFMNNGLNQIDLIFLDIEMPEMTGIDFLKSLSILPLVIIYSSQDKYALESYEYDVTDYLLKPVQYGRFIKAITKAKEKQEESGETISKQSSEIFIKNNSSLVRVKYDDILWIEALENYVVLNTYTDKYTIHFTMKAISNKMPIDKFVRVHRSFIVNLNKIQIIEDNSVIMNTSQGAKVIPIGKSYKDKLMNDINLITK